ncbi:hypothetical protein TRAPUB_8326 [Trametes pubescens]|uniref:Uncharacterized protein n=1 Tax=Trametes pubescens TaxID=154538 RepID=A0A1M2W5D1_TRAPU|nr:hypothetical protein TRAPUB_8326 [Trametes pubescens]
MRMCYLLRNPAHQRGERQLMTALTQHVELGVEFVERWKTRRLLGVAGFCAILSYATMIGWGAKTGDWATGSQIGQFHLAMFSLLFIAVAWSQNHEF